MYFIAPCTLWDIVNAFKQHRVFFVSEIDIFVLVFGTYQENPMYTVQINFAYIINTLKSRHQTQ